MTNLNLNKTKSIGQVIYIVEGDNTEHELIEQIYTLLGYTVVSYNKNNKSCTYLQGQNRYSKVFVIPAAHSAIVKLSEDKDYFDEVYHLLAIDYGLDVENSAIFYLFDRDRRSNRPKQIIPEFERYGNSRVSMDFGMNGLFLLSYPSIEAYLSTANEDSTELESGDDAKQFVEEKHYLTNEIKEENLLTAATLMISVIEFITGSPFYPELLDDFRDSNKAILKYQDNKWARDHKYITLSLLSASLIDLGIISMD